MQDLRLAIRALRATPIVTAVAILSLALGIGANTAVFSLVNSLLLRRLPVKEPGRLVLVSDGTAAGTQTWSYPVWDQLRQRSQFFDGALCWSSAARFNLLSGDETQTVDGIWVSGSFFDTLGLTPLLGRTFSMADDRRGGGSDGIVAVISYSLWQRRFGGATDAIGRTLVVENAPITVVGVLPRNFLGPDVGRTCDIFLPLNNEPLLSGRAAKLDRPNMAWLNMMVRLKPRQTVKAATAALRAVQPQIREATLPKNLPKPYLDRYLREALTLVPAATGYSSLRLRYTRPLLTIMVVVALVLLIACANVANLLLARAAARRYELNVQLALGASRWRLVRQLLLESLLLAGVGAAFGMLIASWSSRLLVRQMSTQANTVSLDLSIDGHVLTFTIIVAVLTALLFGTVPAFRASAAAPLDALRGYGRGSPGDARVGIASGLVVAQLALSLVLIVAAGLFVRTFASLAGRNLGFAPEPVLVSNVSAAQATVNPGQRVALYERTRQAVRALPGVAAAAVSLFTPVNGAPRLNIPILEVSSGVSLYENERDAALNLISSEWFNTLGTAILAGRDFNDQDRKGTPPVAIVNQVFVRKYLNDVSPVGQTATLVLGPTSRAAVDIVGVAADAIYSSPREPVPPTIYLPIAQHDDWTLLGSVNLSLRSNGSSPVGLTKSVAAAIHEVNPTLVVTFRPLADQVNASLAQERVIALLSGFFGALALLLAGLGLYGVTAYAVTRRRTEIGIRMALGAATAGVVRLVLSRVSWLVGAGVIVGVVVSLWASKFVATLLYGLEPRDPATLIGAAITLGAVGAMAGWLPAWRASRIDPAEVLREG